MRPTSAILAAFLALHALDGPRALAADATRASVVKIAAVLQQTDQIRPWRKHTPSQVSGTGVVIEGKRILTNAHLVMNAVEVLVQPEHSSEKLPAIVESAAPGIDLAVLKLEDESFFDDHRPLARSDRVPSVQDPVTVYGYPTGGSSLSITRGIVSRVEFTSYWSDSEGLRVQIDAALNPGNSGGPVMVGDRMIGVAFSGLDDADNIGYVIPCEEIDLFLRDVADGRYDGKPVLLDVTRPLANAALRSRMGLDRKMTGVLVTATGVADALYPLKAGDVIARIGDQAIDNAGMVTVEGLGLIDFHYLVQKLARENKVRMTVIRDGGRFEADVPVERDRDVWVVPHSRTGVPSYFIYGPLVFSEATREQVDELLDQGQGRYLADRGSPLVVRYGDRPAYDGERLVFVAEPTFSHRIFQGYSRPGSKVVDEVNGIKVRNLKHMVEILRDAKGEFTEFHFLSNRPERIVFRREEALRATESILADNGIRSRCSADMAPIWEGKAK